MARFTGGVSAVANGVFATVPMEGERRRGHNLEGLARARHRELTTTVVLGSVATS